MVVFDDKGKFVKSSGKEFKGERTACTFRRRAAPNSLLCDTRAAS